MVVCLFLADVDINVGNLLEKGAFVLLTFSVKTYAGISADMVGTHFLFQSSLMYLGGISGIVIFLHGCS